MEPSPLWTRADLAAFLQVDEATIVRWRKKGAGPPAVRIGKYLRWRPLDVHAWIAEREDAPREAVS